MLSVSRDTNKEHLSWLIAIVEVLQDKGLITDYLEFERRCAKALSMLDQVAASADEQTKKVLANDA